MAMKCLLDGMKLVPLSQTFHGCDLAILNIHSEVKATTRAAPVDQDSAGTADAVFATDVRSRETEFMTQDICQQIAGLH